MSGIVYKGSLICTEQELIAAYKATPNVWRVGEQLGMSGQVAHTHLTRLGVVNKMNVFTDKDRAVLADRYLAHRNVGTLNDLAVEMGRTKQFICRQARALGLTDYDNKISMKPFAELFSAIRKDYFKTHEHPRGYTGKTHNEANRAIMSKASRAMWDDPNSKVHSEENRQRKSDYMTKWQSQRDASDNYTRTKYGWFEKDGKFIFMRSSWELNYAHYLNFLIKHKQIAEWEYEVDTFWFEAIKRGVRSYKPDFKVHLLNGEIEYHEVKGWMDSKSETKLKRMKLYHPSVKIVLVGEAQYKAIKKQAPLITGWGTWITEKPKPAA